MTSQLQHHAEEDRQQTETAADASEQRQSAEDPEAITSVDPDDVLDMAARLRFDVRSDAEPEEVAAIAAGIAAHLAAERHDPETDETDARPGVDSWTLSGRYPSSGNRKVRAPSRSAPSSGWIFAARAHMFER